MNRTSKYILWLLALCIALLPQIAVVVFAQVSPAATPTPDKRGIGIESGGTGATSQSGSQSREAKPELVLQTGYNNFFGATRLVFSPDGRLLATTTFRSNNIKLWETATGRELRNLSSGAQAGMSSPYVAFSRDNRLIAAASSNNSVKIWDVVTGREVQTLATPQDPGSAPGSSIASSFGGGVYFIAFTRDNRVVTISDAVRLWDMTSGQQLRAIEIGFLNASAMMGGEGGAALSPDGNQLALTINEGSKTQVKVWDLNSGRELRTVDLPNSEIISAELAFSADGHVLVSSAADKRVRVWDITAKNDRNLGPAAQEYSLASFSRDGRLVALAENYTIRLWDVASGRELPALKAPNTGLFAAGRIFVAFSEDGKRIATGGFDTPVVLWETETGKQLLKMSGRTNMAYQVAFSDDGTQLSSGGRTRWDLRTGRGLRISAASPNGAYGLPSPNGRLLALFGPNSNAITILETPSGRQLHRLVPTTVGGSVQRASFSYDGIMLVSTYIQSQEQAQTTPGVLQGNGIENQAKIWDLKSGRELRSINLGGIPSGAGFSQDGRILASFTSMGQVSLWDTQSGSKLRDLTPNPMVNLGSLTSIKPGQMPNMADLSSMMTNMMGAMSAGTMGRTVTSVAFSPDGRTVAIGGVESKSNFDMAGMMSAAKGQNRSKNKTPTDPQDFMKSMKVEAIGQVVLWNTATGHEVGALKGHGKGVTQVAFSADGKLLASGSTDNTIRIWDVAARRELRTLVGHTASVDSMNFSPDGRLLASSSEDGSTFLWDASNGEHLLTLISLDDGGEWMVVTPQGLFDGTPVSWNQILWRYNQDTFNVAPIEWFFNEFYHPGLLSDIFAGQRPRVAQDVSKKDRRQPIVKLSLRDGAPTAAIASRTVKVRIEITEAPADKDNPQGTGARDVRLFRNGSLLKVWHGETLNGKPAVTLEEEITLTAGDNRLTAYAFNRDNVKSKDANLTLTGAESLRRAGTAYIIAVGVNEYANADYNLKYAVADAQSFADETLQKQNKVAQFERIEIVSLLNENATKANILAALKRLAGAVAAPSLKATPFDRLKTAQPEDTVIIYFAGHGTAQAQRFYLIPHDLGYTGDRTKLNQQGLQSILSHSISDLELEEAVEGMDAGHLLLVIDACNSGQALESAEKRRGPMNSKGLAQLAYEKGMYILTAAQSYQAALEAAQLGHGLLTYALVEEGLKTSIADLEPKDGVLIIREWLNYATDRVPLLQEEKMKEGRGVGLEIAFTEGEQKIADPEKRSVQRPRVFYRRELEANPLVIAKP